MTEVLVHRLPGCVRRFVDKVDHQWMLLIARARLVVFLNSILRSCLDSRTFQFVIDTGHLISRLVFLGGVSWARVCFFCTENKNNYSFAGDVNIILQLQFAFFPGRSGSGSGIDDRSESSFVLIPYGIKLNRSIAILELNARCHYSINDYKIENMKVYDNL